MTSVATRHAARAILAAFVASACVGSGAAHLLAQAAAGGQRAGGAASGASAFRTTCTNRDFEGVFAFYGTGTVLASPVTGLAGPFSRVGILEADGNGHLFFSSRAAFNGIHFHQDFRGNYEVRPDCTTISLLELPFSHPSIQPFVLRSTFLGIVSDQGREILDIFTDPPGVVIYGRGRKLAISRCTARDLFGSYQLDLNGSTLDLGFPLPFSGAARIEADGNGGIIGQGAFNSGGFPVPREIAGSYTVANDCTFEMSFCVLGDDGETCRVKYALHGVFYDSGEAAWMIVTEPKTAIVIGGLRAQ